MRLVRLLLPLAKHETADDVLVDGEGTVHGVVLNLHGLPPKSSGRPVSSCRYWPLLDVCVVVVVEEPAGATGDIGEEVVLSSLDVVVVEELGISLLSLAQPARVKIPAAAMEERMRFFIKDKTEGSRRLVKDCPWWSWWWFFSPRSSCRPVAARTLRRWW
jgi:hypothetical protein